MKAARASNPTASEKGRAQRPSPSKARPPSANNMMIEDLDRRVTLGRRLHLPQAKRVSLGLNTPESLAATLASRGGVGAWWSPHLFASDYRTSDNWEGTSLLACDVDYYAAPPRGHSVAPVDVVTKLVGAAMPGDLFHLTPRGFRLVFVLDRFVSSAGEFEKVARGTKRLLERALTDASLLGATRWTTVEGRRALVVDHEGYVVDDGAHFDRARLFWTPNAHADGEPAVRLAEVRVLKGGR